MYVKAESWDHDKRFHAIEKETVTCHKFILNIYNYNILHSLFSNPENIFKTFSEPISDFPNINIKKKKRKKESKN